jgi:hypothetical protein
MTLPLLQKLQITRPKQNRTSADRVSLSDVGPKNRKRSWLKHATTVAALAAGFFPAANCWGQTAQHDYLRQQAAALKAQMVRAQVEQAADPSFAAEAYAAQQAYLQSTADKSFRVEKPSTAPNAQFIREGSNRDVAYAMPPVHVSPSAESVAPQPNRRSPQRYRPQPRSVAQRQAPPTQPTRPIMDLPTPEQLGYEGESYAGPSNSVALQDRISNLISKSRRVSKKARQLPSPKFATQQSRTANAQPRSAVPKRVQQPLFDADRSERQTISRADFQDPNQAAYQRMATAIQNRETVLNAPQTVAKREPAEMDSVVPAGLTEPVVQTSMAGQTFQPRSNHTAERVARLTTLPQESNRFIQVPAKQISVLNKPPALRIQDSDNDFGLGSIGRTNPVQELPVREGFASGDPFDSERPERATPADRKQEIDELEKKIRQLEQEEPDFDTRRRQRDLEAAEEDAARERNRIDRRRDLRDEDLSDDDLDDDDLDRPARKTCQEYRTDLLNRSIREISLDMSPRASRVRDQYIAISRSWTDRLGNVVATGTMVDLRRGYVIIDGAYGQTKIPYAKLSDADWAAVSDYWQIPSVCSIGEQSLPNRQWIPQTFTWTASALCHKPLYFENRQLERYGHTHGPVLQPIHSAAHFFVSLATLPYATAIHPPTECRYALGYYRPGNCAPWLKDPLPISLNGLRRQALVTTGLGLLP